MVSIVVTAYNLEKYIAQCLDSILNQTYKNIEVIVVEDQSKDNTLNIIKEYANKDNRIKLIQNEVNVGAGMGRRIGIKEAKGEYILCFDGDDWMSDNYIELMRTTAERTNSDITCTNCQYIRDGIVERDTVGIFKRHKELSIDNKNNQCFHMLLENPVTYQNKLIHRSLYDIVEYSDRRFIEDTVTYVKLLWHCKRITYIDGAYYYYRQHDSSLIHSASDFKRSLYVGLCNLDLYLYLKHEVNFFSATYNKGQVLKCVDDMIEKNTIEQWEEGIKLYEKDFKEFIKKLNDNDFNIDWKDKKTLINLEY